MHCFPGLNFVVFILKSHQDIQWGRFPVASAACLGGPRSYWGDVFQGDPVAYFQESAELIPPILAAQ